MGLNDIKIDHTGLELLWCLWEQGFHKEYYKYFNYLLISDFWGFVHAMYNQGIKN